MRFLEAATVEAAIESASNLNPCELAVASARVNDVGGNRLSPDGPRDPEAGIICLRNADTKEYLAVCLIYSMHPTVLHEDSRLVSADFPGATRKAMQSHLGERTAILYFLGTAGNQSPRYSVNAQTLQEAQRLGCALADDALGVINALQGYCRDPLLDAKTDSVCLPRRVFPSVTESRSILKKAREDFETLLKQHAPRGLTRTAECAVFGAEELLTLSHCQASGELEVWLHGYSPIDVQPLRIGDAFLLGLPGELFVEYGLEIKARARSKVFVATLVNGDLQGYVVTPEAERMGCYEALFSCFSCEAGREMVESSLRLIASFGEQRT